jgi:phosphomannomutase
MVPKLPLSTGPFINPPVILRGIALMQDATLFSDGFVWFRQSRTESGIFRVIAEAKTMVRARQLLHEGKKLLLEK